MIVLTKTQIIALHEEIIRETGGRQGIWDEGLLDSAVAVPFQTFDGVDLFPTIEQKAARLGFGLASNHAFIDGNKRIGAHVMLVFLELNQIELDYSQDELSSLFWRIGSHKETYEGVLSWIIRHRKSSDV